MFRVNLDRVYRIIGIGALFGICVGGAPRAQAQDAGTTSVAELQQRVQDLEAVVRQLRDRPAPQQALAAPVSSEPGNPAAATLQPAALVNPGDDPPSAAVPGLAAGSGNLLPLSNFAGWNEGFFIQSCDRSFQLRITGQIQSDFRGFLDDVDTSTTANAHVAGSPTTGSPDTFLIRRARLGIEATMFDYYEFRLLPDFAGTSISKSITDAYLNIHYWDDFQVEAGKFKQPFSYEQLIQDRYVPTLERSMMDQLVPQRDEGIMLHGEHLLDNRFDYAVAVSNGDPNDSTLDANNHKDFNGRVIVRPFNGPEGWEILHGLQFGMSGGVGVENESLGTTASPPTITTPATVTWFAYNTGVLANGVRDRMSPELAYFYHSFGLASQYYRQNQELQLTAKTPTVDVPISGYYVLTTYLLTGEQRHEYSQQIDPIRPFDPCAPLASPGAWEMVFRVDRLEVGDEAFNAKLASNTGTTNRSSSAATETTTGFNWYLNKWARTQFNWEHADFASPVKIGNAPHSFTREDALYTRLQIIF